MKKGVEKTGLRWTIDELAGDDIPIRIYNKDGKLLVDYSYKCMHRPIFGLDADDVVEINKILDQLLKECESEVNNIAEDIISRQATIDAIKNYFHDEYYQRTSIQDCRDCLIEDVIKSLPSVTPQQRAGRWILADEQNEEDVANDNYRFICSECQCSDIHAKGTTVPYCWNCGVKMEVEE